MKTLGQKVHQWLRNGVVLITIFTSLGGAAIYGNSETAKELIHGKPEPIVIKQQNYDLIINALIDDNKKQDIKINNLIKKTEALEAWHE